jgi:ribose transport system permease protein
MPLIYLTVIAILAAIFLNRTIWGRYLLALGNNEEGARYSGIQTDNLKIAAYVICSVLAGITGLLFAFELDSVQPAQTGEFYELYAIAAAVLGGCSLRGGEGTILGVIIAAAVIRLIYNSINMLGISTHLEYAILGIVILLGVAVDELVKRYVARRRTARQQAGQ